MNNNQGTIEHSPNSVNILDMPYLLNESGVRRHFRTMYKIGSVALHESAFTVYNKNGKPSVSELLLPNITDQDLFSENARDQHTSLDVAPLVLDPRFIEVDYTDEGIYDNLQLSETTQRRINAIKNNAELDEYDKEIYIENIIALDQNKQSNISRYRDDLMLVCHNHPQSPFFKTHPNNILYPSVADLNGYDGARELNTDMFEGIVASDGSNHRLMLFRAKNGITTRSEEYDAMREIDGNNAKKRLGSLAICGYLNVVLELTYTGEVSKTSRKDLDDFLAVISFNEKIILQLSPDDQRRRQAQFGSF